MSWSWSNRSCWFDSYLSQTSESSFRDCISWYRSQQTKISLKRSSEDTIWRSKFVLFLHEKKKKQHFKEEKDIKIWASIIGIVLEWKICLYLAIKISNGWQLLTHFWHLSFFNNWKTRHWWNFVQTSREESQWEKIKTVGIDRSSIDTSILLYKMIATVNLSPFLSERGERRDDAK